VELRDIIEVGQLHAKLGYCSLRTFASFTAVKGVLGHKSTCITLCMCMPGQI
jgi:hypothetical protein